LNGITSLPNFMKIYQAVHKLLVGNRQTGDLINLLLFLRSRGSSVSIVSDFGLDDLGSIHGRGKEFFL
jgi:hypothetical protein